MTWRTILRDIAIGLGVYLGFWLAYALAQPITVLTRDGEPPSIDTVILTSGKITAAEHEMTEGYFTVGRVTIVVPPDGIPAARLREMVANQHVYELVIRRIR